MISERNGGPFVLGIEETHELTHLLVWLMLLVCCHSCTSSKDISKGTTEEGPAIIQAGDEDGTLGGLRNIFCNPGSCFIFFTFSQFYYGDNNTEMSVMVAWWS